MQKIIDLEQVPSPKVQQEETINIPMGYLPIQLSTNGKLGVPKTIHVRNFSTGDLVELSLYTKEMLPESLIRVLNNLILEKVDVAQWPDKIIIELLVKIYNNYFTPIIYDAIFPWNQEDLDYLEKQNRFEEAMALRQGQWNPTLDIDLRNLNVIDIDDTVKNLVVIRKKATETSNAVDAKFLAYPRFGDILMINQAIEERFKEEDKKFAKIKQESEIRERYINEGRDMALIAPIDPSSFIGWQRYEAQKSLYIVKASQALYLMYFNGKDLSNATLEEKIQTISRPEFDINIGKKIEEQYGKLRFGINPEMKVKNPISNEFCTRRFSFRILDIIQAVQSSESSEYDIFYDD